MSSSTDLCTHPAYQRIIGLGQEVVPLLLKDLAQQPDHWFWALKSITGEDPVPASHRGNIEEMACDWIAWGKKKGYVA